MEKAAVMRHNETVLLSLEEGDLVEFACRWYSHWAVYIGDGMVVHVTGVNDKGIKQQTNVTHSFSCCGQTYDKAVVRKEHFLKVAGEDRVKRNNSLDKQKNPAPRRDIVKKALSRLGEVGYSLLWKNCEHFATWCRYGEASSDQVNFWVKAGVVAGVGLLVGGAAGAAYIKNKKQKT